MADQRPDADTVAMKAFLYTGDLAEIVAVVKVSNPPPNTLDYGGRRFVRAGSTNRLDDSGVEQLGWDYVRRAESVVWFRCPECGLVFSDGQSDPGRAWCSCGTSASYPELHNDGDTS